MNWTAERNGGAMLYLVGLALMGYAAVHLVVDDEMWLVVAGETAVLVALAVVVLYGGYRVNRMDLTARDAVLSVGGVLASYLFGVTFAGSLIALQFLSGARLVDVEYLLVTSGTATSALGVGVVLYYQQLRAERTAMARRNEEMTTMNKRLRLLQRVLRHNLRNEVTVIRGHANLLLDLADDDQARSSAGTIEQRARRIEQLSDSAHALREIWDIDDVVEQDAVELVERALVAVRAQHPTTTIHDDLPDRAPLVAHPRFEAALIEVLENAAVHTDGEVAVAVVRADDAVEVHVRDTGDGIPSTEVAALEQPEERPLSHSTGLGLWLVYWLVEKSYGDLRFESNDPHGTVVRIRLPAPATDE